MFFLLDLPRTGITHSEGRNPYGRTGIRICLENNSGYQWLQSLEDETLAFVIVQADSIRPDYHAQVTDESVMDLEIAEDDAVSVSLIVTIPHGQPDQATVNVRAPIVVNLRTRNAKQIILHESIPLQVPLCEPEHVDAEEMSVCLQGDTRS